MPRPLSIVAFLTCAALLVSACQSDLGPTRGLSLDEQPDSGNAVSCIGPAAQSDDFPPGATWTATGCEELSAGFPYGARINVTLEDGTSHGFTGPKPVMFVNMIVYGDQGVGYRLVGAGEVTVGPPHTATVNAPDISLFPEMNGVTFYGFIGGCTDIPAHRDIMACADYAFTNNDRHDEPIACLSNVGSQTPTCAMPGYFSINGNEENRLPNAKIAAASYVQTPCPGCVPQAQWTLDATGSVDPGGGSLTYRWSLHGTTVQTSSVTTQVTTSLPATGCAPGEGCVRLLVTDSDGGIDVAFLPLQAQWKYTTTGCAEPWLPGCLEFSFDGTVSIGQSLTYLWEQSITTTGSCQDVQIGQYPGATHTPHIIAEWQPTWNLRLRVTNASGESHTKVLYPGRCPW